MFSYALSSASTYFHLPVDDDDERTMPCYLKHVPLPPESPPSPQRKKYHISQSYSAPDHKLSTMQEVLSNDDLYRILGIPRSSTIDRNTLRRAYLSRSKACHPDKFPGNPEATHAFQKVSVAYNVLSKPSSKRLYDSRSPSSSTSFFASPSDGHAEETLKSVILGVFNDFLDGDLEMIRTLLRAINDINPSLKLGDEGINSVLAAIQRIRERALTCRTCIIALHSELIRALELQHAFRQLSYFDLTGRSRLTIQLTRITLSLPVTLEKAIRDQYADDSHYTTSDKGNSEVPETALLPRRVVLLIRGIDVVLDRMERILG
ncbi:hypothetical protein SERLA73DRAFT_73565 [Serpula lacrymans var. lacrymans S7.3]|uniref:J domain-containing protein n=2 Tax=Serpula lacrymans var. lacrymans TaxID=341189 RepID=F8PYM9_SERL3|nr:uncharacterized protein SERLADRAFT_369834 [Serpula lacrymans var. lacrymans S7.9]EGN98992.1 hypothetical protein SERLA73DRAFT_73565 [Serpula lacrymans var. lacrymans S7.3]EGO24577.1 hypothetical protein SERLADRAFT_369834 [Serpula lacrymans var. lacrymans S7.9]